jgi:uncharacterized membrane protein (DUF485 family)
MSTELIKKSKWFWHWEDDKEEAWLREMARQGMHLQRVDYFGQYTFATGEPRDVVYRLDFVQSNRKTDDYFQLFRDAGWEYVGEMVGWQYWRKEVKAGESLEIFTDVESKVQKYRRLLGFLAIVFLPVWMGLFNMRNLLGTRLIGAHWIEWVFAGIMVLLLTVFVLYIYIFIRIFQRIRQLRRL